MKDITELKIPDTVYLPEYDIKVRPYLMVDEIVEIAEKMLLCSDIITQECMLILDVLDRCTDIPKELITLQTTIEDEVEDNEEFLGFDTILLCGLWDKVKPLIGNVDAIWAYVDDKQDSSKAIAYFFNNTLTNAVNELGATLEQWTKKMPKGKQWNELITNLPEQLKEALAVMKDDGNAEIINNAMKMGSVQKDDN